MNNIVKGIYKNKSKKFVAVEFKQFPFFKDYPNIAAHIKIDDKKYKIYEIGGFEFFDNNIDACYRKQKKIDKELSKIFKDTKREFYNKTKHSADKSGKSNVTSILYWFKSGDYVAIDCYDWSSTMKPRTDNLNISLITKELNDWLDK